MNEEHIYLDKFKPRPYQRQIFKAIEDGYKKILIVFPRRAGKDICSWQIAIRQCIIKICLVHYVLPTFGQARRCVFDAIDNDGNTFLSYIPKELILKINIAEQKILFTNGSILQCLGGDTHHTSIRGSNPFLVILSEFAYMSPEVYDTISPILAANGGSCIFLSTPYGKNHLYNLFNIAKNKREWFVGYEKTSTIQHVPQNLLDEERERMSPELYEQEYECSFDRGIEGSIFGKSLNAIRQLGQVGFVTWDPDLLVNVSFDIGVNDPTTLIFFQVIGDGVQVKVIDCYSNRNVGFEHYKHYMQSKPYSYDKYFGPHDIAVLEWGGGITRYAKAKNLGITFTVLEKTPVADSLENALVAFPKMWIDAIKCKPLVDALENYYKEWDDKLQVYSTKPKHNWASHYADSFRYMCQAIYKTKKGLTSEEFERKKAEARYTGNRFKNPIFNRDDGQF